MTEDAGRHPTSSLPFAESQLFWWRTQEKPGLLPSVVAPRYNEQDGLPELHRRVSAVCQAAAGQDYEIVVINDGSRAASLAVMAQLAEQAPHLVAINLSRNYGHQIALTAGLQHCRGARVLALDADLQDPPSSCRG